MDKRRPDFARWRAGERVLSAKSQHWLAGKADGSGLAQPVELQPALVERDFRRVVPQ